MFHFHMLNHLAAGIITRYCLAAVSILTLLLSPNPGVAIMQVSSMIIAAPSSYSLEQVGTTQMSELGHIILVWRRSNYTQYWPSPTRAPLCCSFLCPIIRLYFSQRAPILLIWQASPLNLFIWWTHPLFLRKRSRSCCLCSLLGY